MQVKRRANHALKHAAVRGEGSGSRGSARRRSDPTAAEFQLAYWPFFHMNMAVRSYDLEMKRLLKSSGIDMPRWRILMLAHEHSPISVSEVAERAVMELSTATRAIQRLAADGLINVRTRASDLRVSEAVLTAQGRAATERVIRAASRVFQQAFAGFSDAEITALNALLTRVHTALREPV